MISPLVTGSTTSASVFTGTALKLIDYVSVTLAQLASE
jgi:hypothetical protein